MDMDMVNLELLKFNPTKTIMLMSMDYPSLVPIIPNMSNNPVPFIILPQLFTQFQLPTPSQSLLMLDMDTVMELLLPDMD